MIAKWCLKKYIKEEEEEVEMQEKKRKKKPEKRLQRIKRNRRRIIGKIKERKKRRKKRKNERRKTSKQSCKKKKEKGCIWSKVVISRGCDKLKTTFLIFCQNSTYDLQPKSRRKVWTKNCKRKTCICI